MSTFDVAQGHLFGTVFEAALYGIYLVLFMACLHIFTKRSRKHTRSNKIILATLCVMFCLSTAHLGGTIQSLQAGFFDSRPALPEVYFNSKAVPLNLFNKSLYATNMIVGDSLFIYRLYLMYEGNLWVVLPPTVLVLATGAAWYIMVWEFAQLTPGQTAFASSIEKLAPAVFSLSLATNVIITCLMVYRIWQAERTISRIISRTGNSLYRNFIANIVESCIIYSLVLVVTLVLYDIHSNGQDVLTGSMTQMLSIVPTMLWMQVRLGFSRCDAAISAEAESTIIPPIALNLPRRSRGDDPSIHGSRRPSSPSSGARTSLDAVK